MPDASDAVPAALTPYSSPDATQNAADLYADIERDREQYGPRLHAMRGTASIIAELAERWPMAPERKPWEPLPLLAVPVLEDEDIPAGILRLVYDDDTTQDVIVNAEQYLAGLAAKLLDETLTFSPPPVADSFAAYDRLGKYAPLAPYTPSIFLGY